MIMYYLDQAQTEYLETVKQAANELVRLIDQEAEDWEKEPLFQARTKMVEAIKLTVAELEQKISLDNFHHDEECEARSAYSAKRFHEEWLLNGPE